MSIKLRNTRAIGLAAATALLVSGLTACGSGGGAADGSKTLTVSYSEVVGDELPIWIAADAGLFKKEGLNVKLVSLSSDQGFPALISGQTQMASIGASEMVSGAAAGAKVKYLATLTPVFPYKLYTKLPSAAALKGKKIGITSASGSLYIATLAALKQLGLSPKDVHLVPLGSVTNVNNALIAGSIDAALSHPPATAKFEADGFHSILDLAKQKIPTSNVGIAATSAYVSAHPGQVQKFIDALVQGIQREKSDKAYAIKELSKYLGTTDQAALEETYDYYANEVLPDVPTPTVEQLATSQQALSGTVKGAADVNLSGLVDGDFVAKAKAGATPAG